MVSIEGDSTTDSGRLFHISTILRLLTSNDNGDEMPLKTYSCVYNIMIYVNRTVSSSFNFITLDANMYQNTYQ